MEKVSSDNVGILQQVEDLFSAIANLPHEIRDEALKKIQTKMKTTECDFNTTADRDNNSQETRHVEDISESDEVCIIIPNDADDLKKIKDEKMDQEEKRKNGRRKLNAGTSEKGVSADKPVRRKRSKQATDTNYDYDLALPEDKTNAKDGNSGTTVIRKKRKNGSNIKPEDGPDSSDPDISVTAGEKKVKGSRTIYSCSTCERRFLSRSQVKVHMRIHTGEKPFTCEICSRSFTQRGGLKIHMKRHNGIHDHSCPFCEYKSVGKIDMVRHVARHTGERNYACEICGKCFATDVTIKDHIKHVHQRRETYVCQVCGFVTHRHDNLRRHIIVRHSNKEYFQCPVCSQMVKQRSSFIIHMRTHTGERPHKCPKCSKSFKSQSQVAAHLRSHLEGTFQCDDCNRLFKTRFHLRRHSLVHTGEKPFSCMYCSYSCNVKGNVNKHVRAVHGIEDFSFKKYEVNEKSSSSSAADAAAVKENDSSLPINTEMAMEKGKEAATEFLTHMSLRKDERLTVQDLQMQMEEKRLQQQSQKTQKCETAVDITANGDASAKKGRVVKRPKVLATAKYIKKSLVSKKKPECGGTTFKEVQLVFPDISVNHAYAASTEILEEGLEAETVIVPSTGFICVQQETDDNGSTNIHVPIPIIATTEDDDDDDRGAPTMVYLIQCADEKELAEHFGTQ